MLFNSDDTNTEEEDNAMPSIQQTISVPTPVPLPEDLPHGLITPPKPVRERIELERAKHPPKTSTTRCSIFSTIRMSGRSSRSN